MYISSKIEKNTFKNTDKNCCFFTTWKSLALAYCAVYDNDFFVRYYDAFVRSAAILVKSNFVSSLTKKVQGQLVPTHLNFDSKIHSMQKSGVDIILLPTGYLSWTQELWTKMVRTFLHKIHMLHVLGITVPWFQKIQIHFALRFAQMVLQFPLILPFLFLLLQLFSSITQYLTEKAFVKTVCVCVCYTVVHKLLCNLGGATFKWLWDIYFNVLF